MLEKGEKVASGSSRRALRNFGIQVIALAVVMGFAKRILNKSNVPGERIYDPIAGIALASITAIASIVILYLYFKRTEEHDLIAQLWALAWGFLSLVIIKSTWQLLHESSVLGPMNEGIAFGISMTIGCVVWVWHKYR